VFPDKRAVTRPPAYDPENLPADQADRLINRLLPMGTSDTKFVVSQLEQMNAADPAGEFTGRLDVKRLGMFGHWFAAQPHGNCVRTIPGARRASILMALRMAVSFRRA
jgi:hypothetical protein